MGNSNQSAFVNFHKMAKSTTEKDFKTAMDKYWLTFHAEIGRMNPEFKKTKKADFFNLVKIARGCTVEEFNKFTTQQQDITSLKTVKIKPDELKSLRAAKELFEMLIPVMDSQFGADWFMKQVDTAPVVIPVPVTPVKKAA